MYLKKIPSIFKFILPSAIWTSKAEQKLKLSFDDGPHPESTPQLLELLTEYNLKATFFCLGENLNKYPHLKDLILAKGHIIGNHGYEHLSGWATSNTDYLDNALKGRASSGSSLYRPPYGRITYSQCRKLNMKGFKVIMWSHMPGDFEPTINNSTLEKRIEKAWRDKDSIIVLHDNPTCLAKYKDILKKVILHY